MHPGDDRAPFRKPHRKPGASAAVRATQPLSTSRKTTKHQRASVLRVGDVASPAPASKQVPGRDCRRALLLATCGVQRDLGSPALDDDR